MKNAKSYPLVSQNCSTLPDFAPFGCLSGTFGNLSGSTFIRWIEDNLAMSLDQFQGQFQLWTAPSPTLHPIKHQFLRGAHPHPVSYDAVSVIKYLGALVSNWPVSLLGVKSSVFSWSVKSSIMSNCQKCQTIHNVKLFVFLSSFPMIGKTPELRSDEFINLWKFDSIFLMCMLFPLTLNRVSISFLWHLNLLGNFSCVSCSQFQDWINLFPI